LGSRLQERKRKCGIKIKSFTGKKIVVTGGGGFIGSHLVETLCDFCSEVVVLDTMIYGNKLNHLTNKDNLSIYNIDIRNYKEVNRVTENASLVFHLASIVGVENAHSNPIELLNVDIQGTENVLRAAANHGVKKVIFASSSEVYGDVKKKAIEEGPFNCKTIYGYAKLIGEVYCQAYKEKLGLQYIILRYFNIYGPRQDDRFVIPGFVEKCVHNKPPLVYGNGAQTRDFTYIDDAIEMTLLAAMTEDATNQSINVGTGSSVTIANLAELVIKQSNKSGYLNPMLIPYSRERPENIEIYRRVADTSKALKILGYKPKISLQKGIQKYIEWYLYSTCITMT